MGRSIEMKRIVVRIRENEETLSKIERQEVTYYKDHPKDKDIKNLDNLIEKVTDEFSCFLLCLDRIVNPMRQMQIFRESLATIKIRAYQGLLNGCVTDLRNTLYHFDDVGVVVSSLFTIQESVKFCQEIYENAKTIMNKVSSIDLAKISYQDKKEKEGDETFLKHCKDTYFGFLYDVKLFNEKIEEFNEGKAKEDQLTPIKMD
jgi:hypothetical protein